MHGSFKCRRSKLLLDVEQIVQHAAGEVAQIGGAFAEIFVLDGFQHGDVAVGRGVKGVVGVGLLLADDFDDLLDEHAVFEHQQVRVKNIRLGGTHRLGDAALDFGDLLAGADERLLEALDFRRDRVRRPVRAVTMAWRARCRTTTFPRQTPAETAMPRYIFSPLICPDMTLY